MSNEASNAALRIVGEVAPKLAELTHELLFGDIWERPQLSKRDRSLITCTALVALGKTEQMKGHFPRAIANGVTKEELVEMFVHMAFYSGWPSAVTAVLNFREIFGDTQADANSDQKK